MRTRDVLLTLFLAGGGFAAAAQEDVPEVAQRKLDEANRHREAGRAEEAIARYREVIASAPSVLEAYMGLGAIYHESEQYPKALEVFASGLKRFPSDATLLFNVAATEAKLERFDDALAHADGAIKAGGEDAAIFSLRGTILRRLGRQEEAVDSFRKVAALDSKNARAHYNLGNVLYELGRKEEALASFGQAVKLDKDFQPAHYNLGAVLFDLSRFDEALKAYEIALAPVEKDFAKGKEVPRAHARAYLNLGAIFLQRQSWDRALDAYGKAARLDPSLAAAHYNVGFILYHLGRNPEAYQAYERAVKLDAALPLSYLHMGLIDFGAGRMENAARWLEEGLPKLSGEDRKKALLALGPAYRALGDLPRAVESYRAALVENPQDVSALVGLSRLLRQQGKLSDARPLLEKAGEIVLDGSGVALELAALARSEGDSAKERAMYEEALRRDGDRPEMWPVRVNLAASMVRSGDVRDARLQMEMLMKQVEAIRTSAPEVVKELRTAYALLTRARELPPRAASSKPFSRATRRSRPRSTPAPPSTRSRATWTKRPAPSAAFSAGPGALRSTPWCARTSDRRSGSRAATTRRASTFSRPPRSFPRTRSCGRRWERSPSEKGTMPAQCASSAPRSTPARVAFPRLRKSPRPGSSSSSKVQRRPMRPALAREGLSPSLSSVRRGRRSRRRGDGERRSASLPKPSPSASMERRSRRPTSCGGPRSSSTARTRERAPISRKRSPPASPRA
jgi:tetratricopeptide (TPR) repeat protein